MPLSPQVFADKRWQPAPPTAADVAPPRSLTLLTWNVWFGRHEQTARGQALLDEISWRAPDVIALQEVTAPLLSQLCAHPEIRRSYQLSDVAGTTFERYGVVLLSRVPLVSLGLLPLPSEMGRRLLVGVLPGGLAVGTVHLESTAACAAQRAQQLRLIQPALASFGADYVLMGDLNFSPDAALENDALDPELTDTWARLHPRDPGFTVDSQRNLMRRRFDPDPVGRRIDRVLLRGQAWRPQGVSLTGTDAIDHRDTFVSDHFGLEAALERVAGQH